MTAEDLELIWDSFMQMFEHDHSAARGLMSSRKLYIFRHASHLGNGSAHQLFDRIQIRRKEDSKPARSFFDYQVVVNRENMPGGIELMER